MRNCQATRSRVCALFLFLSADRERRASSRVAASSSCTASNTPTPICRREKRVRVQNFSYMTATSLMYTAESENFSLSGASRKTGQEWVGIIMSRGRFTR
ncbi:hypothetical protein E2C01_005478 [Portunus trituberculatus]|uniref:Uncharacterized protein n=1 Tax=Portunus trituberculatus TaxID=210409 RepID=A0A5B7CV92_PORTR|nr:hypothetical protein [Portunus trituberculatus]